MSRPRLKTAVIVGAVLILAATSVLFTNLYRWRSYRSGRLLDGSSVVLESVTYGKKHQSPTSKPPFLLGFLPDKWLRWLSWNPGDLETRSWDSDIFVFWLRFSNPRGDQSRADSIGDHSIRYAIADENGFEAPVPFSPWYEDYRPAGFGTNKIGNLRSFGLYPRRSPKFYLRMYQQDKNGQPVRVANFPIENIPTKAVAGWTASTLPVSQETNGLSFTLEKAAVGIVPKEKVVRPYNSYPGSWSEFRFRVMDHGRPSTGWNVSEIFVYDATGNDLRTAGDYGWCLNGTFSRVEDNQIICTHRWGFWPGEPAWKLRVHFSQEAGGDFWAEYFVRPDFLSGLASPKP